MDTLTEMIRAGDLSGVKELLQDGTYSLDIRDDSGRTPFHISCIHGQPKILNEFLTYEGKKAAINTVDKYGKSAYYYSSEISKLKKSSPPWLMSVLSYSVLADIVAMNLHLPSSDGTSGSNSLKD